MEGEEEARTEDGYTRDTLLSLFTPFVHVGCSLLVPPQLAYSSISDFSAPSFFPHPPLRDTITIAHIPSSMANISSSFKIGTELASSEYRDPCTVASATCPGGADIVCFSCDGEGLFVLSLDLCLP